MMISHLDTTAADERATARIAVFAAACLRDADTVALRGLGDELARAAARGCIPLFTDNSQLVRVMQRLGWEKAGYEGEGGDRSPIYSRIAPRETLTRADHLRIHRLPGQLDLVERRLAQLDNVPREERRRYWHARYASAVAKQARLIARAAALGLRDIAARGGTHG